MQNDGRKDGKKQSEIIVEMISMKRIERAVFLTDGIIVDIKRSGIMAINVVIVEMRIEGIVCIAFLWKLIVDDV